MDWTRLWMPNVRTDNHKIDEILNVEKEREIWRENNWEWKVSIVINGIPKKYLNKYNGWGTINKKKKLKTNCCNRLH